MLSPPVVTVGVASDDYDSFLVFMALLDRMTMSCIMISMALMAVGDIVLLEALSTLMCRTGAITEGLMRYTGVMI